MKNTKLVSKNETDLTVGQKGTKMHSDKFNSCGILVFKTLLTLNGTKFTFIGTGPSCKREEAKNNARITHVGPWLTQSFVTDVLVRILGTDKALLIKPCWGSIPHATTRRTQLKYTTMYRAAFGRKRKIKIFFKKKNQRILKGQLRSPVSGKEKRSRKSKEWRKMSKA